jgi:hypothetical protein
MTIGHPKASLPYCSLPSADLILQTLKKSTDPFYLLSRMFVKEGWTKPLQKKKRRGVIGMIKNRIEKSEVRHDKEFAIGFVDHFLN